MMYKKNFVAVVKCNGSILREREGGTVRLPFGSTYSILLKNKHSRKASVSIEVDGKDVLNGHRLIMEPNSTEEIRGFMRNMRKTNRFKFINKTEQIQRYRGDRLDDGLVRVSYRFEKEPDPIVYHTYLNDSKPWNYGGTAGRSSYSDNSVRAYFSSCDAGPVGATKCKSIPAAASVPLAEEGITVKGQKINQGYVYGSIGPLERSSNVIILHLKGLTKSKKRINIPITVKTRFACEVCGKRSKSTAKYCSRCGNYLD